MAAHKIPIRFQNEAIESWELKHLEDESFAIFEDDAKVKASGCCALCKCKHVNHRRACNINGEIHFFALCHQIYSYLLFALLFLLTTEPAKWRVRYRICKSTTFPFKFLFLLRYSTRLENVKKSLNYLALIHRSSIQLAEKFGDPLMPNAETSMVKLST